MSSNRSSVWAIRIEFLILTGVPNNIEYVASDRQVEALVTSFRNLKGLLLLSLITLQQYSDVGLCGRLIWQDVCKIQRLTEKIWTRQEWWIFIQGASICVRNVVVYISLTIRSMCLRIAPGPPSISPSKTVQSPTPTKTQTRDSLYQLYYNPQIHPRQQESVLIRPSAHSHTTLTSTFDNQISFCPYLSTEESILQMLQLQMKQTRLSYDPPLRPRLDRARWDWDSIAPGLFRWLDSPMVTMSWKYKPKNCTARVVISYGFMNGEKQGR